VTSIEVGTTQLEVRGPVAPRFAFPVIDRVVRARATRVVALDAETETIQRLRIERPQGYHYRAGQHALLRLTTEQGPDLRPLSLAGPPEGPVLEFVTRAGTSAFKRAFAALQPGDAVKVSRPMGGFSYDSARPAVFVAGGIGITPLRSVLLSGAVSGAAPVRLLFSNRSAADVPFVEELSALAGRRPNLSITWILTAEAPGELPGSVHAGRLSAALLRRQAEDLPDGIFYVTGPAAMVGDVRSMLRSVGVAEGRIRSVAQGYR
jgi:ferredoxin-NADP reductase